MNTKLRGKVKIKGEYYAKLIWKLFKNGLSEYDSKYLSTYQYVMLLSKNNVLKAYFANVDYTYFFEYLVSDKEYTPLEALESEMSRAGCDAGIMYENVNGQFNTIAFIDLNINY